MNPKQYRPIILKTLKDAKTSQFKSVDELADRLISRMEDYSEMLALAGGADAVIQGLTPDRLPTTPSHLILPNTQPATGVMTLGDLSERLPVPGRLTEHFTKDQLHEYYGKHLPPFIEVQPPGFTKAVKLSKRMEISPGDMTFVKVSYLPEGGNPDTDCMQVTVQTTDIDLDAARVRAEIETQALARLSPTQRRVEPRFAIPPPSSLDAGISGSPSADTDKQASAEDLASWGRSDAATAAQQFDRR